MDSKPASNLAKKKKNKPILVIKQHSRKRSFLYSLIYKILGKPLHETCSGYLKCVWTYRYSIIYALECSKKKKNYSIEKLVDGDP